MNRIKSYIAAGEGERAKKLALAIMEDPRFEPLEVNAEIPVDVMFSMPPTKEDRNRAIKIKNILSSLDADDIVKTALVEQLARCESDKIFNCELKECPDYISSALGKEGHLFLQHLAMRESGHPAMILVLGGDAQVNDAIYHSLKTQYRGDELSYSLESYKKRLQDFEAKSFALGIPVMRWQLDPFSRLLSHAAKVLLDGNLMDYMPRPADGERELVSCCCLTRGIGPETWRNVLAEYQLQLLPRHEPAKPIEEIVGIGRKRAEMINPMVRMVYR